MIFKSAEKGEYGAFLLKEPDRIVGVVKVSPFEAKLVWIRLICAKRSVCDRRIKVSLPICRMDGWMDGCVRVCVYEYMSACLYVCVLLYFLQM